MRILRLMNAERHSEGGFPLHFVIMWGFFTLQYYFATGHDFTVSKIQWGSAYIGFEENNIVRSAILVLLNTFSSPVIFGLLLPLLVIYTSNPKVVLEFTKLRDLYRYFLNPFLCYMFFFGITTTCTIFFVYMERRHLMVFRVFAPKYVFDTVFLLVVDFVLVLCVAMIGAIVYFQKRTSHSKSQ